MRGGPDPHPRPERIERRPVDLSELSGLLVDLLDPGADLPPARRRVTARIDGIDPSRLLLPLEDCPDLDLPAWRYLRDRAQYWLLPGAQTLSAGEVVSLRTNPQFVEQFLVGFNQQALAELRWRGHPVRAGCTPLRRFWDRTPTDAGARRDDIVGVSGWIGPDGAPTGRTGEHPPPAVVPERLVVVIRSELFRRYPATLVSLAPGATPGHADRPANLAAREWPEFIAALSADLTMFAFRTDPDLTAQRWIVVEEVPDGIRFTTQIPPPRRRFGWCHHRRRAADEAGAGAAERRRDHPRGGAMTSVAVMLPARIETRFDTDQAGAARLRVIVIPADVWFDRHDPRVSEQDIEALRAAAQACDGDLFGEAGVAAFERLAGQVGAGRAAWLGTTLLTHDAGGWALAEPDLRRAPEEPAAARTIRGLPGLVEVWATLVDSREIRLATLRPKPELRVEPGEPGGPATFWPRWGVLKRAGLTATINLAEADGGGPIDPADIAVLTVVGLGTTDPGPLLTAHRHAGAASLMPPGSPTNSTPEAGYRRPGPLDWRHAAVATSAPSQQVADAIGAPVSLPGADRWAPGPAEPAGVGAVAGAVGTCPAGPGGMAGGRGRRPDPVGIVVAAVRVPRRPLPQPARGGPAVRRPAGHDRGETGRQRRASGMDRERGRRVPRAGRRARGIGYRHGGGRRHRHRAEGARAHAGVDRLPLPLVGARGVPGRGAQELPRQPVGRCARPAWGWTRPDWPPRRSRSDRRRRWTCHWWTRPDRRIRRTGCTACWTTSGATSNRVWSTKPTSALWRESSRGSQGTGTDCGCCDSWHCAAATPPRWVSGPSRWCWRHWGSTKSHRRCWSDWWCSHCGWPMPGPPTTARRTRSTGTPSKRPGGWPYGPSAAMTVWSAHWPPPWTAPRTGSMRSRSPPRCRRSTPCRRAPRVLGLYGWVDSPLRGEPGFSKDRAVLAPSPAQAKAAAILKDRYVTHAESGLAPGDAWDLGLDSHAVRRAVGLLDAVAEGAHPAEALGRRVEACFERYPDVLRLRGGDPAGPPGGYPADGDAPLRRTCDGLAAMRDWAGDRLAFAARTGLQPAAFAPQVTSELDALAAVAGVVADLHLLEAVHDTVQGGSAVTAQALDSLAGLGEVPELRSLRTPVPGHPADHTGAGVPAGCGRTRKPAASGPGRPGSGGVPGLVGHGRRSGAVRLAARGRGRDPRRSGPCAQ